VVARSKRQSCGRWLVGIAGSNPVRGMDVSFSRVLHIAWYPCLRRADHPPRGVLLSVYVFYLETSTMMRPRPHLGCCLSRLFGSNCPWTSQNMSTNSHRYATSVMLKFFITKEWNRSWCTCNIINRKYTAIYCTWLETPLGHILLHPRSLPNVHLL